MMRQVTAERDSSSVVVAVTAGLTTLLFLAADRYVELVAAGVAYVVAGVIVHQGTLCEDEETTT